VDKSASPIDDPDLLAPLLPPPTTPPGEQEGPSIVTVFLLQGDKLVRRTRAASDTLLGVERALVSGRASAEDQKAGLTTALQRVDLNGITDDGDGRYTIDTTPIPLDGSQLTLAHAQLALTAFELPTVIAVRFSENGRLVASQTPRATKPPTVYVTAADYSDIAPALGTTSTTTPSPSTSVAASTSPSGPVVSVR
jgi:hypothetical protein